MRMRALTQIRAERQTYIQANTHLLGQIRKCKYGELGRNYLCGLNFLSTQGFVSKSPVNYLWRVEHLLLRVSEGAVVSVAIASL